MNGYELSNVGHISAFWNGSTLEPTSLNSMGKFYLIKTKG